MLKTKRTVAAMLALTWLGFAAGCGSPAASTAPAGPSPEGAAYRLASEPAGAKDVKQVRADAKDDEAITVVGRIGGDTNPWIDGQAAFLVVDLALKPCSEAEGCPTPWDYCCSDSLSENKALVKVLGADGKPVAMDARKLLGLKELQTVVVQGKAQRDETGNLTVLADGVFVRN